MVQFDFILESHLKIEWGLLVHSFNYLLCSLLCEIGIAGIAVIAGGGLVEVGNGPVVDDLVVGCTSCSTW